MGIRDWFKKTTPAVDASAGARSGAINSLAYAEHAEERSIVETGVIPISPQQLDIAWGMGPTRSGVQINERTALTYSAVFAAVKVLADALAMLPLKIYEGDEDSSDHHVVPTHPLYGLMRREPNPEMSAATFKETLQGNLGLWGNAYARIVYNNGGKVGALFPIPPDKCRAERFAGALRYTVEGFGGRFAPEEIVHVPGLSYNGINGLSPVGLMRETIAMGKAAELYGAAFWGNGANTSGTIEYAQKLTPEQKANIRQGVAQFHEGIGNAHRVLILDGGAKYARIGIPPEDGQFLETRAFQVRDVARIYRIPAHMIGDLEKAGYASLEQLSLEFLVYSLTPWLTKWEQELTRKLLGADSGFFVKFDTKQLLRADHAAKQSYMQSARQWGIMTQNEGRALEDLPPVPGGDVFLQPVNMVVVDKDGKATPIPVASKPVDSAPQDAGIDATAMRVVFEDAFSRMLRKEQKAMQNVAEWRGTDIQRAERANKFYDGHASDVVESLRPAARTLCALVGGDESLIDTIAIEHAQIRHDRTIDIAAVAAEQAEDFMESLIRASKRN